MNAACVIFGSQETKVDSHERNVIKSVVVSPKR